MLTHPIHSHVKSRQQYVSCSCSLSQQCRLDKSFTETLCFGFLRQPNRSSEYKQSPLPASTSKNTHSGYATILLHPSSPICTCAVSDLCNLPAYLCLKLSHRICLYIARAFKLFSQSFYPLYLTPPSVWSMRVRIPSETKFVF